LEVRVQLSTLLHLSLSIAISFKTKKKEEEELFSRIFLASSAIKAWIAFNWQEMNQNCDEMQTNADN
jgi:hypothetical protein